jgi:gluconolactonase
MAFTSCGKSDNNYPVLSGGYDVVQIVSGLKFGEGPAWDGDNLYFSDIDDEKIYQWNDPGGATVYREQSGGANGLFFDKLGNLVVCEGVNKRVTKIDAKKELTVISDTYNGKPFNEPNDLWISPSGNTYFTDPVFKGSPTQDAEGVYCVLAGTETVIRVSDDLVKPNGITGTADGSVLYIADYGASKIYRYNIAVDGTLTGKTLFVSIKADGLTLDSSGNLLAAADSVRQYDTSGNLLLSIGIPGTITNLCFGGNTGKILYVTTHSGVYSVIFK